MPRSLVVKKFGGTSVGDVSRIQKVARIVWHHRKQFPDDEIVVVVSAMSGETSKLIALAQSCVTDPDPREMDVLIATGEQVTIALTAMAIQETGIHAQSLLAQQARIATDRSHTKAQILDIDTVAANEILLRGAIPVVAGFQGVDDLGNVTTLGRGGSDITAVALAAALDAKACYIYTDVPGVFSTDPRICKKAVLLDRVCHEEMLEMASLGAKVLHPRSVYFAMTYHVPLVVLSTFEAHKRIEQGRDPQHGTWIVKEEELMEKPIVTGITYRSDEAKITVFGVPHKIHSLSHIFDVMAHDGIFIDMITQSGAEDGKTTISFTVPDEASEKALSLARNCVSQLEAQGALLDRNIAKISVVGIGMRYHTGVAAKMFQALASEQIEVEMIATSEIKISVIIPRKYCEIAVRTLHEQFIEMDQGRGIVVQAEQ